MGLRFRWSAAAKGIVLAVAGLAALQVLPPLLRPAQAPPLPADVGLPPVKAAPLPTREGAAAARGRAGAGKKALGERASEGRQGSGRNALRRSGSAGRKARARPKERPARRRDKARSAPPTPPKAPAPVPPVAPAPEAPPATPAPALPATPTAPAPQDKQAPAGDGSEEFTPR